jgi:hypothetical protein
MKITKFKQLIALTALAVLAAVPVARGDASLEDFHVTNSIPPAVSIVGNPVTPPGTVNTNTGNSIGIRNMGNLGILVTGTAITTNATATDSIQITFIRAAVSGQPVSADFETGSSYVIGVPLALGTNTLAFLTNLPAAFVQAATHVGISRVTNNTLGSVGTVCTNFSVHAVKKIIPITYP